MARSASSRLSDTRARVAGGALVGSAVDAVTSLDVTAIAGGGVWLVVGHRSGLVRLLHAERFDESDERGVELRAVKLSAPVHRVAILRVAFLGHDHERFLSLDTDGVVRARFGIVGNRLTTRTMRRSAVLAPRASVAIAVWRRKWRRRRRLCRRGKAAR